MDKKDSMWKKLIRKTIGKRKEEIHKDDDVVFVKLEVNRKGITRNVLIDKAGKIVMLTRLYNEEIGRAHV